MKEFLQDLFSFWVATLFAMGIMRYLIEIKWFAEGFERFFGL